MENLYFLIICIGSVFTISAQTECSLPANLQNGLLAYYPFGAGGTNDASGNLRHLANTSTANTTTDRNGNVDCAFEFDNMPTSTEFLTFVNPTFLNNLNQMSLSLWYMPEDATRLAGDYEALISRDVQLKCPDRYGEWSVGLYDCRRAVFGRQDSVWETPSPIGCDVPDYTGTWKHLVAIYDTTIPSMKIYINGVLQDSSIQGANCGIIPVLVQDIGDLFIGKDYTGKIDDIFIYDRAITPNDIAILYNLGSFCCTEVLSVDDHSENLNFTIYPNPVGTTLNIIGIDNAIVSIVTIYNTLGQQVLKADNVSSAIDVSPLSSGTYIIKVQSDTEILTSKFLKN